VTTPSRLTAPPGRPLRRRQHGRGPPVARLREAGNPLPGPARQPCQGALAPRPALIPLRASIRGQRAGAG